MIDFSGVFFDLFWIKEVVPLRGLGGGSFFFGGYWPIQDIYYRIYAKYLAFV